MSGATARLQKALSRPVLLSKLDGGRTSSHHLSSLTLTKSLLLASRFAASTLVATTTSTTSAGVSTSTGTSNPDPGTTIRSQTNRNPSTYTSPPNSFSRKFSWGNLLGWHQRTLPNKYKYNYGTHDPQGHLNPSSTTTRTTDTTLSTSSHGERAESPYFNLTGHLDDLSSLIRPFLAFLDPSSLSSSYSMASYAFSTSSGSDLSTPRSSSPHSSASVASARSSHSSTFSAAKRMSISSVRRTSASNPMSSVDLSTIQEALKMASLDTLRGYCQNTYGEVHQETATEYIPHEEARGYQVLNEPHWNKGKPTSTTCSLFVLDFLYPFPPRPTLPFSLLPSPSLIRTRALSTTSSESTSRPCSHHQSLLSVKGPSCLGPPDYCTHARLAYIHVSSHLFLLLDPAYLPQPHLFPVQHFLLFRLCHIHTNRPRPLLYTTWLRLLTSTSHPKGRLLLPKSVSPRT